MYDVLPDSRAKTTRNRVFTKTGTWIPFFCANCGKDCGLCPEESTHMFYLCNPCFETKGAIAGTMVVPDAEFFAKVQHEQLEAYGRALAPHEVARVIAEDCTPLAKLIKEAQ